MSDPYANRRHNATNRLGFVAIITGLLVAILALLAPAAAASPSLHPQTRVAAIGTGTFVGTTPDGDVTTVIDATPSYIDSLKGR